MKTYYIVQRIVNGSHYLMWSETPPIGTSTTSPEEDHVGTVSWSGAPPSPTEIRQDVRALCFPLQIQTSEIDGMYYGSGDAEMQGIDDGLGICIDDAIALFFELAKVGECLVTQEGTVLRTKRVSQHRSHRAAMRVSPTDRPAQPAPADRLINLAYIIAARRPDRQAVNLVKAIGDRIFHDYDEALLEAARLTTDLNTRIDVFPIHLSVLMEH